MTNTPGDPEASWVPPGHESLGGPPSGRETEGPGNAVPTQEIPGGGTGVAVPAGDGSAQPEDGPRTREDLRPSAITAAPADLPTLTRELPAPGQTVDEAASDLPETPSSRSGPWDAVVAPFTAPATRHDQSAPRFDPRTAVSRGEHLAPGAGGRPPSGPTGHGNGPGAGGAPSRPLGGGPAGPPGGRVGDPPAGGRAPGAAPRRTTMAFVAAGAAVVVAGAIALAFGRLGGASQPQAGCAGEACSRQTSSAAAAPQFRYRTVERDTGYFEGTVTLVNRGATPLRSWTLTFTYPGADVHNAWEVVLRQTGQNVAIVSAPTAEPIAPGDEFEVRFGGAGRPGVPTNCRFNGAPCAFVR